MCGIVGIIDFKEKYNSIETSQHLNNILKNKSIGALIILIFG